MPPTPTPTPRDIKDIFGTIAPPTGVPSFDPATPEEGLIKILNVGLELVLILAGFFTLFNFLLAGFTYITSNGDPKKVSEANSKMTFTVIGLTIIVLTPLAAAIIGIVIFGRWDAILNPEFKKI